MIPGWRKLAAALGPADVSVAERIPVGPGISRYPAQTVSLSRAQAPVRQEGDIHPADPIRYSDWYMVGKPYADPGQSISFVSSIAEWQDSPPMGFIRRPTYEQTIAQPRGRMAPFGTNPNIEPAPAVPYGNMATYSYEQLIPGVGGF